MNFLRFCKKKADQKVSFKDMGAGGITCSTVEQVARAVWEPKLTWGAYMATNDLPPYVIACSETQERFA